MKKIALVSLIFATSCTLSLQNISTHGTASDVVDDTLSTTPTVNAPVSLMPSALPGLSKGPLSLTPGVTAAK